MNMHSLAAATSFLSSSAPPPAKGDALVTAAFQTSLENLLLEATRQRTMDPLRDALQSARLNGYTADNVFHTFVIACDSMQGRKQHRTLLLQNLGDLGKIASLQMLPVTADVVRVICKLVRRLLGYSNVSNTSILHSSPPSTRGGGESGVPCATQGNPLRAKQGLNNSEFRSTNVASANEQSILAEGDGRGVAACKRTSPTPPLAAVGTAAGVHTSSYGEALCDASQSVVADDELHMSILQMLMSYLSACELSNAALSEIMGIIFTMHMRSVPQSLLEASCAAAIEQRTLAHLNELRHVGNDQSDDSPRELAKHEDGGLSIAQLQSVAFFKDICALCTGEVATWLQLTTRGIENVSSNASEHAERQTESNGVTGTRRLRILLLKTLIKHFHESEPISSPRQVSAFFSRCLNTDVVALVLGCARGLQCDSTLRGPRRDSGESGPIELELQPDDDEEEEFSLAQELGVTVLSSAFPLVQDTVPIILRHHLTIVKPCSEGISGERGARHTSAVLALWRRAIANHNTLRCLLLSASGNKNQFHVEGGSHLHPDGGACELSEVNFMHASEVSSQRVCIGGGDGSVSMPTEPFAHRRASSGRLEEMHPPFVQLVVAIARLVTRMLSSGMGAHGVTGSGGARAVEKDGSVSDSSEQRSAVQTKLTTMAQSFPRVSQQHGWSQGQIQTHGSGASKGATRVPRHTAITGKVEPRTMPRPEMKSALEFLAVFTQAFAHVVRCMMKEEASREVDELKSVFSFLHPSLLQCHIHATGRLLESNALFNPLKSMTHLVEICCRLGLSAEREGYLQIFHAQLFQRGTTSADTCMHEATQKATPSTSANRSALLSTAASAHASQQGLYYKLQVLDFVILIAFDIGVFLDDGWQTVVSCLLATPALLQELAMAVEQEKHRPNAFNGGMALQYSSVEVNRIWDAFRLLFISSAFPVGGVVVEKLLTNVVNQMCDPQASSKCYHDSCAPSSGISGTFCSCGVVGCNLFSLCTIGECCALALMAAAWRVDTISPELLVSLWNIVRCLYLRIFDAVHLSQLLCSLNAWECVAKTLGQTLENIAVVMAQFCRCLHERNHNSAEDGSGDSDDVRGMAAAEGHKEHPGFSVVGLYASTSIARAFTRLGKTLTKMCVSEVPLIPVSYQGSSAARHKEVVRHQLLNSMAELLDTIYDNLHKLSFSDVALSSAGMDADEQSRMLEPLQAASGDVSLLLLKEVSRLVQDFGEELRGLAWSHLLQLLRRAAVGWECETTASLLSITGPEVEVRKSMKPRAFNVSAAARQGINVAFRILEAIQHSHITNLDENGLRELVECGGAFMSHRLPPGEEQRLNINLSAVQLLWSVADYSASMDHTQHEKAEYKGMQTKDVDGTAHCGKELWCTLLLQLRNGCLDLRPEVRQGALKTLFTLVQTYSGRLHADCWRCLLGEVLGPLMSLMLEATGACTIAAPPSRPLHGTAGAARPGQQQSTPIKERRSNVEEPQFSSGGCAQVQECTKNAPHWAASLLTHFSENPAFFDDMRLTVMDSVSRVFVSYHVVMRVALVDQAQDEKQRGDGIFLLDSTLARFIELCGTARFVAQTTTGEGVALAAIGALHSLMMVIVGASSREEPLLFLEGKCEAAWLAVEQILRRDDTCIHTASRQCTQSVVASLVTMLGEVVILQRTLNAQRQFCTISTTPATSQSLIGHLLSARAHGSAGKSGDRSPIGDYLPRYIRLVKECLCSQSVAEAYYFPSRVQSSAIEMWKLIWSLLATHERGAVINVTLEQFPTAETLQEFVTQELPSSCGKEGQMCGSRGGAVGAGGQQQSEEKRFISLQDALPRGAHPNFLLALVNFLLHVIQTECSTASQRVGGVLQECVNMDFIFYMAPAVVRATSALLVLEYATPKLLTVPGSVPAFYIPPDLFDRAEQCMSVFLSKLIEKAPACAVNQECGDTHNSVATYGTTNTSATLATSQEEGFAAFSASLYTLVPLARMMVERLDADSAFSAHSSMSSGNMDCSTNKKNACGDLQAALRRLDRLVQLLGRLIPHIAHSHSNDLSLVVGALQALVPCATVKSPMFAKVAQRSLELLRRWSSPQGTSERQCTDNTLDDEGNLSEVPLVSSSDGVEGSKRFHGVAHASMSAQNRALLQRFLSDTKNEEARRMAKTALQTIVLLYPTDDDNGVEHGPGAVRSAPVVEEGESGSREVLRCTLLQLVRLVAHTGPEEEFSELLSRAMLGICTALGLAK